MRLLSLFFSTLLVASVNPTYTYGQNGDQHRAEEQPEPYHKHHDTRYGHDHYYPDRGAVVRDLPRGTIGVNYAGVSYRFHDGVWLEPRGPAFIVVAPPIGLIVPTLPTFTTLLARGGDTYLYANDVYYRPRPDLGGYEVVNAPVEASSQTGSETVVGAPLPGAPPPAPQAAAPAIAPQSAIIGAPLPAPAPAPALAASATANVPTPAVKPSVAAAAAIPPNPGPTTTPPVVAATTPPVVAAATPSPQVLATTPVSMPGSTAAPPALPAGQSSSSSSGQPRGPKVFVYPKNGQSPDQQARDRYECYRFAVAQSGFDPMRSAGATPTPNPELQSDFERAQGACFDARGYTSR